MFKQLFTRKKSNNMSSYRKNHKIDLESKKDFIMKIVNNSNNFNIQIQNNNRTPEITNEFISEIISKIETASNEGFYNVKFSVKCFHDYAAIVKYFKDLGFEVRRDDSFDRLDVHLYFSWARVAVECSPKEVERYFLYKDFDK